MIRGFVLRALCFFMRLVLPKYRSYEYEAGLAMGILHRLKFQYAAWMLHTRRRQMQKADLKKQRRKRGVKRKLKK